jgi:hypothetical protein
MLGDEDGVAAHRRLTAVVEGLGRREALGDQVACMLGDDPEPTLGDIAPFLRAKAETAVERRTREAGEDEVEISHGLQRGTLDGVCQRR